MPSGTWQPVTMVLRSDPPGFIEWLRSPLTSGRNSRPARTTLRRRIGAPLTRCCHECSGPFSIKVSSPYPSLVRSGLARHGGPKPGERRLIGECVLANSVRRATVVIKGKRPIIREKKHLTAEQANTPAKRIYLSILLMYTSRDAREQHATYFSLVRDLVRSSPQIEVTVGGGIASKADLFAMADAGVSAVLVGSALHDGRIGAAEIAEISRRVC